MRVFNVEFILRHLGILEDEDQLSRLAEQGVIEWLELSDGRKILREGPEWESIYLKVEMDNDSRELLESWYLLVVEGIRELASQCLIEKYGEAEKMEGPDVQDDLTHIFSLVSAHADHLVEVLAEDEYRMPLVIHQLVQEWFDPEDSGIEFLGPRTYEYEGVQGFPVWKAPDGSVLN